MPNALLAINNLAVTYGSGSKAPNVLRDVSLSIGRGETLGLVGESGSGKTTLGRAVLGLVPVRAGRILFDGEDIAHRDRRTRRRLARTIQVVFQDPYTSLNPAMKVGDILTEPLIAQGMKSRAAREHVGGLLARVNLSIDALERYPREFSGGQRQRIAIARALALNPRLIVCDEPVSSLDLSTQVRVLDLLIEIQQRTGVAYLFISHDLAVVRYMSHRVAVMYEGRIVETGPARQVTGHPTHPYTQRLQAATLVADPQKQAQRRRIRLDTSFPSTPQAAVAHPDTRLLSANGTPHDPPHSLRRSLP
jgi:peptide/nickel transport system ATP-binding protein